MSASISQLFNRFAGREVDVRLGLNDPTLVQIRATARTAGLADEVRVWGPGITHINDSNPRRLNIYIGRSHGYKAKISNQFHLG